VLKLLIMLDISLITVIYKRIACVFCATCCQRLVCPMLHVSSVSMLPVLACMPNVASVACVWCAQCCMCPPCQCCQRLVCQMLSVSSMSMLPVSSVPNVACVLCVNVASLSLYSQCCQCCLCLVCQMLPVSLDCPFLIAPSVFCDVYLATSKTTNWKYVTKEKLQRKCYIFIIGLNSSDMRKYKVYIRLQSLFIRFI